MIPFQSASRQFVECVAKGLVQVPTDETLEDNTTGTVVDFPCNSSVLLVDAIADGTFAGESQTEAGCFHCPSEALPAEFVKASVVLDPSR